MSDNLIKFGNAWLPLSFLLADGYESTPNQRTELEAYRDADIYLHRVTSPNHKTSLTPATLEGDIVRVADKIAYVNHDIDDGIRAGVLSEDSLPKDCTDILGHSTSERINTIICDAVEHSVDSPRVNMSDTVRDAFVDMRKFLFTEMYTNPVVKSEEVKAAKIIEILYEYYLERPEEMPGEFKFMLDEGDDKITVVCDYIAGMTDNFAVEKFQELYIPRSWSIV